MDSWHQSYIRLVVGRIITDWEIDKQIIYNTNKAFEDSKVATATEGPP